MISAVKARFHKKTHKYGICMPCSIKEALEIDARTGIDLWRQELKKEMKNVNEALLSTQVLVSCQRAHEKSSY